MRHLYVHIPFCRTPCAYCDFASNRLVSCPDGHVDRYSEALQGEIRERAGVGGQRAERGSDEERRVAGLFQTVFLGRRNSYRCCSRSSVGLSGICTPRLGIAPE
jgi:hypothetical protein